MGQPQAIRALYEHRAAKAARARARGGCSAAHEPRTRRRVWGVIRGRGLEPAQAAEPWTGFLAYLQRYMSGFSEVVSTRRDADWRSRRLYRAAVSPRRRAS